MTDLPDVDAVVRTGLAEVTAAEDLDTLDSAAAGIFGKKGTLSAVQRLFGQLDDEGRRTLGRQVNEAKARLQAAIDERRAVLADERDRVVLAAEALDVTLPPRTPKRGTLHPVTETMEAMVDVLVGLGYRVVDGPEVETDWHNFAALNIPADHPARSQHDTIYVEPLERDGPAAPGSTVLRTHTSPMQARAMLATPPPLYIAAPGRVYRQETPDATHAPVFHQIEGLAVDRDLSLADLRGTLSAVARALLGADIGLRFVPDHFPFTEPSCQLIAVRDGVELELLGAGMVHPNVLRAVGYDPEDVSGFAFGMGVERIAMLRHRVEDLRLFAENDLRFLSAF